MVPLPMVVDGHLTFLQARASAHPSYTHPLYFMIIFAVFEKIIIYKQISRGAAIFFCFLFPDTVSLLLSFDVNVGLWCHRLGHLAHNLSRAPGSLVPEHTVVKESVAHTKTTEL
ncbi:hypothetical protein EDB92DRAFT_435691 [Lactarius akahatsu]|uniref:Uncharacterized protein n=1 Tax=Lactarius akahatsu TaxID=416441 RepID=A0AAD4LJK4_9AGAM|nr:hypothetical protein EDB92DRAFT_435691 [Lactarius akahatsu]